MGVGACAGACLAATRFPRIDCRSIGRRALQRPSRTQASLIQRFIAANSRLSAKFDARKDVALYHRYDRYVADAIDTLPPGSTLVDVGGGRTCSFASELAPGRGVRVVAVDISPEELAANTSVDATYVADVAEKLPFAEAEIDMLVSRTVLEHVKDVERAAYEMSRVLRPGGLSIHLFPCRYALFAIVARVLPFWFAKGVLHRLIPESRGVVEFDVYYDHCHPAAAERIFREAGFVRVEVEHTWDQAAYFHAFFPAFLLVLAYQRLCELLQIRLLASYVIVRAHR